MILTVNENCGPDLYECYLIFKQHANRIARKKINCNHYKYWSTSGLMVMSAAIKLILFGLG